MGLVVKPAAKIRFRASSGIPEPVSAIEISTKSPSLPGAHRDRAVALDRLAAFTIKFRKAWFIRPG